MTVSGNSAILLLFLIAGALVWRPWRTIGVGMRLSFVLFAAVLVAAIATR